MPEIRKAGPEDYEHVHRLLTQHVGLHDLTPRSYEDGLGKYTLAVAGDEVLGFCFGNHRSDAWGHVVVTPEPPRSWRCSFIAHLVVDRHYRRRGVGALLLRDFLDRAELAGNSWVVLDAASPEGGLTESELHAFYGANGFQHLRHRPDDRAPEGWEVDHYLLGCQVHEDDQYEFAVLDGPHDRPDPPPQPPETEDERTRRAQQIEEIRRRYSGPADHPLATHTPRGGRRRGF